MPNLYDGRDLFLKHLETRRRAEGYIKASEDRITEVILWLEQNTTIRYTYELGADSLEQFVSEKYGHLADGTFNLYIGHLRRWIAYLAEEGKAPLNASRKLLPRERPIAARAQQFLHEEKMWALAAAARQSHVRDEFYIKLSYYLARRWSEISKMTIGDIDFTPGPSREFGCFTFVNAKGRKTTTRPLPQPAAHALLEWFGIYRQEIGRELKPTDYLIPALRNGEGRIYRGMRKNRHLTPTLSLPYSSASSLLRAATERAGWSENAMTHGLRRGSLDDLLAATGDLRLVMTMADHGSEKTTEKYVNRSREVQDLGDAFSALARGEAKATKPVEHTIEAEQDHVVVSFAERRARRGLA